MHTDSLDTWQHTHAFLGVGHEKNERRTWAVIILTATMMVAEIVGGSIFGSMALVADGWHMSSHAGALAISALAYGYARRHARDPRFAFGTGKLGELAGFTSAIVLSLISLLIAYESFQRLRAPIAIAFDEAIAVAVLGLAVNIVSAWLLRDGSGSHSHSHNHHPGHSHAEHGHDVLNKEQALHHHVDETKHHAQGRRVHRDNNLRSAYVHVIADAATSVLAIIGLLAGRMYGLIWMDAVMGIVGACVIANWAYGLARDAGGVLLDVTPDTHLNTKIRSKLEVDGDRVADLHLWQLGPGHFGAIVSLVTHHPQSPAAYKFALSELEALSHVTVEVQACR